MITLDVGTTETPPPQFEEAVRWFRGRVPMTQAVFDALAAEAQRRAFTLAGAAALTVVSEVWRSLDATLTEGRTLRDFKRDVAPGLLAQWGGSVASPAWRMEVIFRNATQRAYTHGRVEQLRDPAVARTRPYWMFDAIGDARTSAICAALDGTVLRAGDSWWASHTPPCHHACRSTIRGLRANDPRVANAGPAPDTEAQAGFGVLPEADDWAPRESNYPADVWAAYQGNPQAYRPPAAPVRRPATQAMPAMPVRAEPGTAAHLAQVFRENGVDIAALSDAFDAIEASGGAGYEYPNSLDPAKLSQMRLIRESFNGFFVRRGMTDLDDTGPDMGDGRPVGLNRSGRHYFNVNAMAPDNALSRGAQSAINGSIAINRVEMSNMAAALRKARSGTGQITREEYHALELVLHEHGHSFTRMGSPIAYQGIGLSIEEVTNEVASRMIAREVFGVPSSILPHMTAHITGEEDPGMYSGHISSMRSVIANAHGVSGRHAGELLERACVAFKSMPYDLEHMENWAGTPEGMANIFARAIASVREPGDDRSESEIERAAHDGMRGIWGEYRAAELERIEEERQRQADEQRRRERAQEEERAARARRAPAKRR